MFRFSFIDYYRPNSVKRFLKLIKNSNFNSLSFLSFACKGYLDLEEQRMIKSLSNKDKPSREYLDMLSEEYSRNQGFHNNKDLFNYCCGSILFIVFINVLSLIFLVLLNLVDLRFHSRLMFSICFICFSFGSFNSIKCNYPIMLVANALFPSSVKFRVHYLVSTYFELLILCLMIFFSLTLVLI